MKNLKKILAAVVVIGTFTAYVLTQRNSVQNQPLVVQTTGQNSSGNDIINVTPDTTPTPAPVTTPTPTNTPTPKPITKPAPAPAPKPIAKGIFADGSYTGNVVDAYFGNVQVQAVVTNSKLSDVVFLQYPSDRSTSLRKSQMAMPILKSESISAQSAQVNTVSGATETSLGFIQSMQSALDQAKA